VSKFCEYLSCALSHTSAGSDQPEAAGPIYVPQRGNKDGKNVEAIVKVLAELFLAHGLSRSLLVPVISRTFAADGAGAAEPFEFFLLQNPQELDCVASGMSPISSRNSVPPSASRNRSAFEPWRHRAQSIRAGGRRHAVLDEIGDIPLATQVKLLRVLQEKEFERLGGTSTIRAKCPADHGNQQRSRKGHGRGKVPRGPLLSPQRFYHLCSPLRERKSDLLLLADHFLQKYAREHKKDIRRISTPAIDMLTAYHWPGNVRELENVIERAVLVCDAHVVHGHHLPPTLQTARLPAPSHRYRCRMPSRLLKGHRARRAENHARQSRESRSPARHNRTHYQLQSRKYGIDGNRFRD